MALKVAMEKANQSYEPLMTAPRIDMGDSYEKAFQNYRHAEDLLIENKRMLWNSFLYKNLHKINHFWWWLLITVVLSAISAIIGIFW